VWQQDWHAAAGWCGARSCAGPQQQQQQQLRGWQHCSGTTGGLLLLARRGITVRTASTGKQLTFLGCCLPAGALFVAQNMLQGDVATPASRTTRIFVARIPQSVTDTQFRAYFEKYGKLQDAYMPRDHSRQMYRGIGFVTFASPESVEKVMACKHWCVCALSSVSAKVL
jgi:hypothetical protein